MDFLEVFFGIEHFKATLGDQEIMFLEKFPNSKFISQVEPSKLPYYNILLFTDFFK